MALKWGILGCGVISEDFARAMKQCVHENKIVAAGASSKEKALNFKEKCQLDENTAVYGSYEEVLQDKNVEIIYIGLMNHQHHEWTLKALDHGKPVLCEKPLACNYKQAKEMIDKAKEKKLFCMEAFWSRCFPVYKFLKEEVEKKVVGEVKSVFTNFGLDCLDANRFKPELGASPLNDIGCYTIALALWIFGNEKPEKISAIGKVQDGCDIWATISIDYSDGRKAVLTYSAEDFTPIDAMITCENGRYHLPDFFNGPTKIVRYQVKKGASEGGNAREIEEKTFEFDNFESDKTPYNLERSSGLRYEADHVYECIKAGKTESPIVPFEDSLMIVRIIDEVRKQLGVIYGTDNL